MSVLSDYIYLEAVIQNVIKYAYNKLSILMIQLLKCTVQNNITFYVVHAMTARVDNLSFCPFVNVVPIFGLNSV